uniref:Variant surface glycoprotein 1125.2843 n=1 Tax=Trypanosoma brucei TaxID=5691 RepID=A0A1J0R957_9TRYP|nr:variant surface glycoprotein 1125.2843 [Trypanosoma brucei]
MAKVAAYVAHRLQQLGREAEQLQELRQILLTAVLPTDGALVDELSTLLLLADKLGVETAQQIEASAAQAIRTSGQCAFYAGRLTEFVSIFNQAKNSGGQYCVEASASAATAAQLSCISDDDGTATPIDQGSPTDLTGVAEAYAAIAAQTTELAAGGSEKECGLTVHDNTGGGYIPTHGATTAINWGNKMFTTASNAAVTTGNWQTKTTGSINDSTYQECSKHLTSIEQQLTPALETEKLLLLLGTDQSTWQDLKIPAKSVADKYPEKEITVKGDKLKSIHETIKKFKQNNAAANKVEQALAAATLVRISLN